MWKKKIRTLLKDILSAESTDKMSLRALANAIGVSPGALSEIVKGKRGLSERTALQILETLNIEVEKKEALKNIVKTQVKGQRTLLGSEAEVLISHWFFPAILCLFETRNPPKDTSEIAERLGLPHAKAAWAVDLLLQHGLLKQNPTLQRLEHAGVYWTTTDNIPSEAIKKFHLNELKLAAFSLNKIPVESRDFTSITFSGNSAQLDQAKKEFRRFRDRIAHIMSEGDSDQVYKLNIQFFPVDGWNLGGLE